MPFTDTFVIKAEDNSITFTANFGDGAPIVTEGYAGWTINSRPKDVGTTEWQGRNPMAIEIPFELDYYTEGPLANHELPGVDCEGQVTNLEQLCGIGSHAQPPTCIVDGSGVIPHDYSIYKLNRWVIEQLSWDRSMEIRSSFSGRRLKCGGTITIRQFVEASDILQRISPSARAIKPKTYTVKHGDTLTKIASKVYGDSSKWKLIADANGLRDHRSLVIGKKIKIP